jgi:hypothetical protein
MDFLIFLGRFVKGWGINLTGWRGELSLAIFKSDE